MVRCRAGYTALDGERVSTIADPVIDEQSHLYGAWGLSTSVDLCDCDAHAIRDPEVIEQFVLDLCTLIDMRRFGECQIVHFGEGRVAGFSMLQLIETSLISGHFANDSNRAYLDIFSCKGYDPSVVADFARRFFGASSFEMHATLRH
jgi:S-adenosylmethionine/arginine decarboxylase-like enzyme